METLLLTDLEASRLLGISRSTFHVLVAEGRILRLKIGRSARYRRADILIFTEILAAEAGVPGADPSEHQSVRWER
jgi:excisionase family DNA binding protein